MKICVVGAGWYGCHIARNLIAFDVEVCVLEKKHDIFTGSSGANQNRLHLGFHYPRNYRTRLQSLMGYERFLEDYSEIVSEVPNNIYSVPNSSSLIDFTTYQGIMASSGIPFSKCETPDFLSNIEGSISTKEMLINVSRARDYFTNKLGKVIEFGHEVKKIDSNKGGVFVDGIRYDYLIDCTWGHLFHDKSFFYEVSLLLLMQRKKSFGYAITLVDGDLWSLYPTEEEDLYTLSSVLHTPVFVSDNLDKLNSRLNEITDFELEIKKKDIIDHAKEFFPTIEDYFDFYDFQLSVKTKPTSQSADRSCYVNKSDRIISVLSGKIDNIFYASDYIMNLVGREA
jgi:hypothetical protein